MAQAQDASPLEALLGATHLAVPDEMPGLVQEHGERLGASTAVVFLADLDQRVLAPLSADRETALQDVAIDATLAGRCYRSTQLLDTADSSGDRIVWVPLVDGTERLGVLQLVFPDDTITDPDDLLAFSSLIAELIVSKSKYGDFFDFARRRRPLSVAAELLWQLLPPLTFATPDLVITGALVPTAELGGDAFDYGVDLRHAQVAIFDGMGHGLHAGLLTTTAVAAFRNGRRRGRSITDTAGEIGRTIENHFGEQRFVTGVLASLEIGTGRLSLCAAGHPPPLLLRGGHVIKSLSARRGMPFGIGPPSEVFQEQLEPGDTIVLYTDGVTEARTASGEFFGIERVVDLIARVASDDSPPETMRRLMHAIERHNHGPMRDDATVVLIEWRGRGSQKLLA
jgi:Stage II sporulation protein E (SpoIIE)